MVKDLSECLNTRLISLKTDYDEVILVFDTYKADYLKSATREKQRQGKDPIRIRSDMISASNTSQLSEATVGYSSKTTTMKRRTHC